jgi:dinuclear metal center YbgI/SA1388 family protein
MNQRIVRIHDLVGLLNALYPPALAEGWDNVGLQVGDPRAQVSKVLVCLDASETALQAALDQGAEALLCHHPLIFQPLRSLTPRDETGRILFAAVQQGIAIIAAHTNLDRADNGLNDWLAAALGLSDWRPLLGGDDPLVKLIVYVPAGYEGQVADALFKAGAGQIGNYDNCSFRSEGIGTFHANDGCSPFMGKVGERSSVRELRLETVVPQGLVSRVVERMTRAHPYEEVAYDLVPLANRRKEIGLGRIGRLAQTTTLADFAATVKEALQVETIRVVGNHQGSVSKVAVCGGSGASLLKEAARQGADVLVTGDVKYHEARNAASLGLALIDAGHFATERLMAGHLAEIMGQAAEARGLNIEFLELKGEEDPFETV